MYKYHEKCRICGTKIDDVIDLGILHLNHFPAKPLEILGAPCPLVLALCPCCGLVQLRHTVPPAKMYGHYWYRSGINEMMVENLKGIVGQALGMITLEDDDTVIDIGANDGTLLKAYKDFAYAEGKRIVRPRVRTVAYEPAKNLISDLIENADPDEVINDFFPCAYAGDKAKIITSIAMFYDLEDPVSFVRAIKEILHPGGIWILELAYLPETIKQRAFDSVCHEHLEYYTLQTLDWLLGRHGLRIIDAETNDVNGGSMRVFVAHRTFPPAVRGRAGADGRIRDMLVRERGFKTPEPFERFAKDIARVKDSINRIIESVETVDLYGASTKGNTLLQVCGIGPKQVRWALERSPAKWGRYTITGVPIVEESQGRADPADLWVVLPWHFRESIIERELDYVKGGGRIFFPMPHREIVMRTPKEGT
ncbi:MAG: class I SAM-dependent methyltransferase [Planctomycetota bacterium]|jgi:NDP-4-keto-2,6-dideoxyhexose 3-C-methyltransferase